MSVLQKKDISKKNKSGHSKHKAELMAYAAQNKKAIEPIILDLRERSAVADFFVVVSGKTDTQVRAIVQEIERVCQEEKIKIAHIEGLGQMSWVLIDLDDIMVHVFRDDERHYYGLETLWNECKRIDLPLL